MSDNFVLKNIFLNKKIGSQETQILLEVDIIVPDIKPDMASILQTQSDIFIEKTNILQDKINFIGKLNIQILYIAKLEDVINNLYLKNYLKPKIFPQTKEAS